MKKVSGLLLFVMLTAVGCSGPEAKLTGQWKSNEMKGFTAEFKKDHTGETATPIPGHGGAVTTATTKVPFEWSIDKGKIKITEDKKTFYYGQLKGKKLELEVNGHKTVLVKAN
jgi:hypothetical protein